MTCGHGRASRALLLLIGVSLGTARAQEPPGTGAGSGDSPRPPARSGQKTGRVSGAWPWSGSLEQAERAVTLFEQALVEDPGDADAATNLGQALMRLGRGEAAETAFRRAIELAPARATAYAQLAELWSRDPRRWQRRDEMMGLLRLGLERVAGDPVGRVALTLSVANFERSIGRTRAASARLEALTAASLSPAQRQRVLDLVESVRTEEQARALVDWPEPAVAPAERIVLKAAEAALARGEAQGALEATERLARTQAGWWEVHGLRARAWEALGRYDDAEREWTVLLQLAPSQARAWRRLGLLLATHGGALDAERADEALRHALVREPGWWDLWLVRAQVAARRGRLDEARRWLERYLGEAPERAGDAEVRSLWRTLEARPPVQDPAPPVAVRRAPPPSDRARALYREAIEWINVGDPGEQAPALLTAALEESPGYVSAAVTAYAVLGWVPERTVRALWGDGEALFELARRVRALGRSDAARELVLPWVDRAVALGVTEARFERALIHSERSERGERGERAAALADLREYVALTPAPLALAEARVLLANLREGGEGAQGQSAESLAELRLLGDRPADALETLGGRCDATASAERLVARGKVAEWSGDLTEAAACYRRTLDKVGQGEAGGPVRGRGARQGTGQGTGQATGQGKGPTTSAGTGPVTGLAREALERLAGVAGRMPLGQVGALRAELERASASGVAAADWALGRLFLSQGDAARALERIERFLARAPAEAPERDAATRSRTEILAERERAARRFARRRLGLGLGGAGLVMGLALLWLRGAPLGRALGRCPALFPEVARTIAELRHDVLKHRTSVLGLVATDEAMRSRPEDHRTPPVAAPPPVDGGLRAEVARVLWEPERASEVVAAAYERLRRTAQGRGVTLRPLGREPTFGPLVRDLRRAEVWVQRAQRPGEELARIDARLRGVHSERLGALAKLGPRTRVDAALVSDWIRGVEAELKVRGVRWTRPVLELHGLELDVPVERSALATIFSNLLRNAQEAVAGGGDGPGRGPGDAGGGAILVRVSEERDATGRRQLVLLVGDNAPAELTLEMIEKRESGRGLAIVRDLVHEWRGHLVIRPGLSPFRKGVGACFPA
ncbi:MAG TPA: tetratricopeptide repeat protein [Polyangia bacterium]|nr:tetratricopeptide repeat protein [Polyangia bacterium]